MSRRRPYKIPTRNELIQQTEDSELLHCERCKGKGRIYIIPLLITRTCPACGGFGVITRGDLRKLNSK